MTAPQGQGHWDIGELKGRYPLLGIVERAGVQLRRSGSHRWQGNCPFHDDRTPSFFVDVETQRFVCFGCKVRGDVIDFVRLREQLTSVGEACAWLAGMPPPPAADRRIRSTAEPSNSAKRWDRLALYRHALWRNRQARSYLAERGLDARGCGRAVS